MLSRGSQWSLEGAKRAERHPGFARVIAVFVQSSRLGGSVGRTRLGSSAKDGLLPLLAITGRRQSCECAPNRDPTAECANYLTRNTNSTPREGSRQMQNET